MTKRNAASRTRHKRPTQADLAEFCQELRRYLAASEKQSAKKAPKIKPPPFDKKLWFTMGDDCHGKHYLLNQNPHTYEGLMRAWCPTTSMDFYVSKKGMDRMSPVARYWIQGFLCGNEPAPPRDKHGDWLPFEDSRHQRWIASAELFAETGYWNEKRRMCRRCRKQLPYSWPEETCRTCKKTRRSKTRTTARARAAEAH